MIGADTLLAGPRGRRFVMEFLVESERARSPEGPWPLDGAVLEAASQFEDRPGSSYAVLAAPWFRPGRAVRMLLPPVWSLRRLLMRRRCEVSAEHSPAQSPAQVVERLSALTLPPLADDVGRAALRASVDADMDPLDQYECWPEGDTAWPGGPPVDWDAWRTSVVAREHSSRGNLRADSPRACAGGVWASLPYPAAAVTTRLVRGVPLGLDMEEDSMQPEAATVNRCAVHPGSRVLEIDGAETWAQLCQQYPLEVTAQMRGMWWDTTGRDGRWVIPDWSCVAEHYDAVHMQCRAYLAAAGTAIDVDGDAASVIAGWTPDSTVWFRRVGLTRSEERRWSLAEDEVWKPDWTGSAD